MLSGVKHLLIALLILLFTPALLAQPLAQDALTRALEAAGENRPQLEAALARVPEDQCSGLRWLVEHMPADDLKTLGADYLVENCTLAYEAWRASPWKDQLGEELFLDAVLPYASINERRDAWRADFRSRFAPLVKDAKSPGEAAAILNNEVFGLVGVKYSTKRRKADQSPYESMETGLASCTGLSVLLIDACRSVGVPARFVGTPLWSDGSGNHSWVEVWDDGWHFTGAAEPSGHELDKAWFTGRAAGATREDPRHAIYAVTWRKTPIKFPMVWKRGEPAIHAVDVTDRYTRGAETLEIGNAYVRFRVLGADGERCAASVRCTKGAVTVFEGEAKDERFDANDHLTAELPLGVELAVTASFEGRSATQSLQIDKVEQLVTITLGGEPVPQERVPQEPVTVQTVNESLRAHLASGAPDLETQPFARIPLSAAGAAVCRELLWTNHARRIRAERAQELEARVLEIDGAKMPFWYTVRGEKPAGGRSLFLSMHGGGGAPKKVNDRQWENQKKLYEPEEGIYLAPRAPTDTWNLWHQAHIDGLFDRLIENLVVLEEVDPDRVYLMGYSAGGDGVYQLAPRMADRFAAAAMMAGHPNETSPDGLRNLAFTLHMGGDDDAYDRAGVARRWKELLAELAAQDEGGYEHWVEVHEGKGHWMDKEDAAAVPWMACYTRDLRSPRVVWRQDDVTHTRFYWLADPEPAARRRIVVEREGQELRIVESGGAKRLALRLDDDMLDLDQEVVVSDGERELFRGRVPRTIEVLARTLAERGDPRGVFSGEVVVDL
ncbi:MAG: polyhydroxyalkanoate depolymerase [bacterium]|nr:polyhydroxyalkanoate depolymerase [bacterium]